MKLETENMSKSMATPSDITSVFANPEQLGEFIILGEQQLEYLQAAVDDNNMCLLEYRIADGDQHFQAAEKVNFRTAEAVFLDYLGGGADWKSSHTWRPLDAANDQTSSQGKRGCAKNAAMLCMIAVLLTCFGLFGLPDLAARASANFADEVHDAARQDETSQAAKLPTPEQLAQALEQVLGEHAEHYGLIAGVITPDHPAVVGAAGVRKKNSGVAMTPENIMHLGSCTKAMTATVAAMFVEEGKLDWNSTLPELLPDMEIHEGYQNVTLHQLFTHRAGMPRDPTPIYSEEINAQRDDTARRKYVVQQALREEPAFEPNADANYSNLGLMAAGYILELKSGMIWQDLYRARLFEPLGMASVGFGPTAIEGHTDQPWGHTKSFLFGITPTCEDIPSYYGPCGTVHCSLGDWGKFALLHMGHPPAGQELLKPETMDFLHTAAGDTPYGCGWVISARDWAKRGETRMGTVYTHGGSNGRSHSVIWIAPELEMAFLAATNSSDAGLCDAAIVEMLKLCELLEVPQ